MPRSITLLPNQRLRHFSDSTLVVTTETFPSAIDKYAGGQVCLDHVSSLELHVPESTVSRRGAQHFIRRFSKLQIYALRALHIPRDFFVFPVVVNHITSLDLEVQIFPLRCFLDHLPTMSSLKSLSLTVGEFRETPELLHTRRGSFQLEHLSFALGHYHHMAQGQVLRDDLRGIKMFLLHLDNRLRTLHSLSLSSLLCDASSHHEIVVLYRLFLLARARYLTALSLRIQTEDDYSWRSTLLQCSNLVHFTLTIPYNRPYIYASVLRNSVFRDMPHLRRFTLVLEVNPAWVSSSLVCPWHRLTASLPESLCVNKGCLFYRFVLYSDGGAYVRLGALAPFSSVFKRDAIGPDVDSWTQLDTL
ncbi:hypothetical protein C8J56DRAFT_1066721 [Mycena floridula]|nr:hypothetical protein C8J56DRAFT_1066721 [Mycena floridula]